MPDLEPRAKGPGWEGLRRGYTWETFTDGNTVSVRSGFWVTPTLRPDDRAEVEEIAASIRDLLPIRAPEFEIAVEQFAERPRLQADCGEVRSRGRQDRYRRPDGLLVPGRLPLLEGDHHGPDVASGEGAVLA
jgi:hypothetical protein